MKLLLVDNAYLFKDDFGFYYSKGIYTNEFFNRYTNIFENVIFACKIININNVDIQKNMHRITDNKLNIFEIPTYKGVKQLFFKLRMIIKSMKTLRGTFDCSILRMAQIESILFFYILKLKKTKYLVEVVNDPINFKNINYLYRIIFHYNMKKIIKKSNGVSYVTKSYLQKKYSPRLLPTTNYSSISLKTSDFRDKKTYSYNKLINCVNLIHVSNNIQDNSKGHLEVLKVVKLLKNKGYNCIVSFIGDGSFVEEIKQKSIKLKIENNIKYFGHISSKEQLFNILNSQDIFIFPSYFEGLPRVVVEAMACGLPCITSNVGGLQEIIDKGYTFSCKDVESYANTIIKLINDPNELNKLSSNNIEKAKEYTEDKLSKLRKEFYNILK